MAEAHQAIKVVARRTGLSAHVIRIWEKRYGAVEPERTGTNRRLYSEEQIERLHLLGEITRAGHSIGNVAKLPAEKLRQLAGECRQAGGHASRLPAAAPAVVGTNRLLDECVAAVKTLDAKALEAALTSAENELGGQGMLQRVVAPLAQTIGDLWRDGTITIAHEHFATSVIRVFLSHAAQPFNATENAPVLVVATPAGQIHELGALLVGAAAANLGWKVANLGASLPAGEIARAAQQMRARAVALSIVYPEDDANLPGELARLREVLPEKTALLIGGRAMPAYRETLESLGALLVEDLVQLGLALDELRRSSSKTKG